MNPATLARAAELSAAGLPFALATVVRRERPTSGQVGASAIVHPDGRLEGWLGGACAQPTVIREALSALADGRPRLLLLGDVDAWAAPHDDGEVVRVPMACESDGALEVHVLPVLPAPLVVAVGRTPAVRTLVRLAGALGWRTAVVDDGGTPGDHPDADRVATSLDLAGLPIDDRTFVVVATQGHHDEQALLAALATPAGYVGLVASAKRADGVRAWLAEHGVDEDAVARVHAPAGLDLGRVAPDEIAVAILAELVERRAAGAVTRGVPVAPPATATDPVCGMAVDVASAQHTAVHDGEPRWFCSAGCRRAFAADPASFAG